VDNGDTLSWILGDLTTGNQQSRTFALQVSSGRKPEDFDLVAPATLSSQTAPDTTLEARTTIQTNPLSVELEYFAGTANYPSHILLEWQSVSEIETLAYRLYRGTTPDPNQAGLLVPSIPATNPGSPIGAYYSHQDSFDLTPGVIYYYWIEDLDTGNHWNQHRNEPNLNPEVPWGCSVYDVVCNFVIGIEDITAIANHWNCAWGSACYDITFDVNRDNGIDVRDVMLSAGRWACQLGDACYP
jgi:hypothetical protein